MTTAHISTDLTAAQLNFDRDRRRIQGRRRALLDLLWDGAWHPNYECAQVGGISFHCSLYTLRREGWEIESRHVNGGVWEYRLTGRSTPRPAPQSLTRPQARVARELLTAIRKSFGDAGAERVGSNLAPWLAAWLQDDSVGRNAEVDRYNSST